jgi:hypothetical protein
MTPEQKIENQEKIDSLRQLLAPLHETFSSKSLKFNNELRDKVIALINPCYPIHVRVNLENITFFSCKEASEKGLDSPYADFGSEVTLSNSYNWRNFENMEKDFFPEISCSGVNIKFDSDKFSTGVIKIQLINLLATELQKYQTENVGSTFIRDIAEIFKSLRLTYKEINKIESQISSIKHSMEEVLKKEEQEAFEKSFKEGNWYHLTGNPLHKDSGRFNKSANYEVYFHIAKVTDKTVTVDIHKVKEGYQLDSRRVPVAEVYTLLKNRTLLTECPIKKETV